MPSDRRGLALAAPVPGRPAGEPSRAGEPSHAGEPSGARVPSRAGEPSRAGVLELAAAVRGGARSARAECERRLALASEREELGAFWVLAEEHAVAQAEAVDRVLADGRDPGALAGVPVAWKDSIDVAGLPTSAGVPPGLGPRALGGAGPVGARPGSAHGAAAAARWFAPGVAAADAVVVARARAAGSVELGKLAMHQLAWGMSGQCPGRAPCRNPHDPERIPGGSSSGSAVAVAAGLVDLAGGTDSGGSVRAPAALCGIVGLMPSFGRVPLEGVLPLCPTLDHVGSLARSVADCAVLLDVMCGAAPRTHAPAPLAGLRVGVLERGFCEGLDAAVEEAFRAALARLARAGACLVEVDLGWHEDPEVLRAIFDAEPLPTVAGLGRAHPAAFGADIRAGMERGLRVTALDYLQALERLQERRRRAVEVLPLIDVVVSPTVPLEAPRLDGPDLTTTLNRNTKPFNGLRWPALSLPCGLDSAGLSVGLQLAAGPGRDGELISVALAVEACLASVEG